MYVIDAHFSTAPLIPTQYERFMNMGEACVTIAQPVNDKARIAMSSLAHALYETGSYAVGRLVKKAGAGPVLLLMAPLLEPNIEGLVDVPLPFAEDVRHYKFPPLDKVIGISGSVITKHRYLPTDNVVKAMSDYVDSEFFFTAPRLCIVLHSQTTKERPVFSVD